MGLYAVAASQLVFLLIHTVDRSNLDTFLQKRNSKTHAWGYQVFTAWRCVRVFRMPSGKNGDGKNQEDPFFDVLALENAL